MKVVGIVGRIGADKDAVAFYLKERYGAPFLDAGDVARQIARKKGIRSTRENLHKISQQFIQEHGADFFMHRVLLDFESRQYRQYGIVSICGIRTPKDASVLRSRFGEAFILVYVRVEDADKRFLRMKARGTDRDATDYDQYIAFDEAEEESFHISETAGMADVVLDYDGSLTDLGEGIEQNLVGVYLAGEISKGDGEGDQA
jgi:dephospho-CoA kinase